MPFKRDWDATYPKIWHQWETDGKAYVIQDIPPDDDERALAILMRDMCRDEYLCGISDLVNDQKSMASIRDFWEECLSQRMSLGCYTEVEGKKTLVALNVCVVASENEKYPLTPIEGAAWKNVYGAMAIAASKCDPYKYLGLDTLLHAYGLLVTREFRGAKLGAKLLMARQPLALSHGVKGTTTVFTGPASQTLAARCGYITIQETSLREIAEAGLNYPKNDHVIKVMVKKFCD